MAVTYGDLALRWPWLVAGLALLVVVLLALWVRRWRHPRAEDAAYVAHAERLAALPRYRTLVRTRMVFGALTTAATLVAVVGAIILAGRVEQTQTSQQDETARDIMLCLDASGSMAEYNVEVLQEMQDIVEQLGGERIGLAIWSKATITVFPLTDDYDFAQEQLRVAETAFDGLDSWIIEDDDRKEYYDFIAGTQRLDGKETVVSQIGDGLASCVQRFGDLQEDRGRAVILASDNEPYGKGVFTLDEASEYAIDHEVVVHGIGAEGYEDDADELEELQEAVEQTGGIYGEVDDGESADEIVAQINELEAAKLQKPPVVQDFDRPRLGTIVVAVGLGLLVLVWLAQGLVALVGRRSSS
jgi:Ca-activated chloride channel family protein